MASRARQPRITASTPFSDLPQWLTAEGCAIYLCLSKGNVHEQIRRGDIPSRKIGGKHRVVSKDFFGPGPEFELEVEVLQN